MSFTEFVRRSLRWSGFGQGRNSEETGQRGMSTGIVAPFFDPSRETGLSTIGVVDAQMLLLSGGLTANSPLGRKSLLPYT